MDAKDPLVLINADDFGSSRDVNHAIVGAFNFDLIDSCTIMANFPEFEAGCDAAHAGRFANRVGLHLVLDDGAPLTDDIRREPRLCAPDGRFVPRRRGRLTRLTYSEKRAIALELTAQIRKCRSFGLPLTHLDSHHHMHEEPGVIGIVVSTMRDNGINVIRPMQNLRRNRTLLRRAYTSAFNTVLRLRRLSRTRFFGSVSDYLNYCSAHGAPPLDTTIELMVHPTIGPDGKTIVDAPQNTALAEAVAMVSEYRKLIVLRDAPGRRPSHFFS